MSLTKNATGDALTNEDKADIQAALPLGPYATLAALQAAFPASGALAEVRALVGSAHPYTVWVCNGVAWVQAPVSGGGNLEVADWPALVALSGVPTGTTYRVREPVCTGGVRGTAWTWDGTFWCPAGHQDLYAMSTQIDGASGGSTSEQILGQVLLPANALRGVRQITLLSKWGASGADTNVKIPRFRLGSAGTTSDGVFGIGSISPSARDAQFPACALRVSTTIFRPWAQAMNQFSMSPSTANSSNNPSNTVEVAALTNALYVSASIQQGASPSATISLLAFAISIS